jgi:hypothetical protein
MEGVNEINPLAAADCGIGGGGNRCSKVRVTWARGWDSEALKTDEAPEAPHVRAHLLSFEDARIVEVTS